MTPVLQSVYYSELGPYTQGPHRISCVGCPFIFFVYGVFDRLWYVVSLLLKLVYTETFELSNCVYKRKVNFGQLIYMYIHGPG